MVLSTVQGREEEKYRCKRSGQCDNQRVVTQQDGKTRNGLKMFQVVEQMAKIIWQEKISSGGEGREKEWIHV